MTSPMPANQDFKAPNHSQTLASWGFFKNLANSMQILAVELKVKSRLGKLEKKKPEDFVQQIQR